MEIPRIQSYPMPGEPELPSNVAPWRPDRRRAVLVLHDFQRHFVERLPAMPGNLLLENAVRLAAAARANGVPLVFTGQNPDTTVRERGLLSTFWGPGLAADPDPSHAAAFVSPLTPGADDLVVRKRRYSAFHRTGLAARLRALGRDQVILAGVYAHIGCLATVADAFAYDLEAFLVGDAVADFSARHHRLALEYAAGRCAVVLATDRVVGHLTGARGRVRGGRPALPVVPVN